MSERGKFLIYCIEAYKAAKGARGREILRLFETYGATDYILESYEALHTTGERYIVDDIEGFILDRKRRMTLTP